MVEGSNPFARFCAAGSSRSLSARQFPPSKEVITMFEHHRKALIPRPVFYRRLVRHAGFALGIIGCSLGLGVLGYHFTEGLGWLDSLLNASMILSGMGPVNPIQSTAGKLFASFYALFSGVAFITSAGVLFVPVVHRLLHRFHLDDDSRKG